jgi:pyrimidine-nucleoside phosphorylase
MLYLGDVAESVELGKAKSEELLKSGAALKKFREMVKLQGGNVRAIDDASLLPRAKHTAEINSSENGFVAEIDCQAVGIASVILGGGRAKKEDSVDSSVGIVVHKKLGDTVSSSDALCTIHYNSETQAKQAAALLEKSFRIANGRPEKRVLIRQVIGG